MPAGLKASYTSSSYLAIDLSAAIRLRERVERKHRGIQVQIDACVCVSTQFTCFTSSKVQILTPEGASEFKRVESFHRFGRFSLKGQSFGGLCQTYVRLVAVL
jgi:hypothetical protein